MSPNYWVLRDPEAGGLDDPETESARDETIRKIGIAHSGIPHLAATTKGGVIKNLQLEDIRSIPLKIAPPKEQGRIVAEIEKQFTQLDAGVASLKRVQIALKRYRISLLKAAWQGRLVPIEVKLPEGSRWKSLGKAIRSLDQGWSPKCDMEPSDAAETWGGIKTTAVQSLRYLEAENKRLTRSLKPREHLEVKKGDLLVTRAGPRSRVGAACLATPTLRQSIVQCAFTGNLEAGSTAANQSSE